jgi:uncharacterized membrane protein YjfL (UPF0719 family)
MSPLPTDTNAETVAWNAANSLNVLGDQQRRAESLQTRAGQIAGFAGATVALGAPIARDVLGCLEGIGLIVVATAYFVGTACLALTIFCSVFFVMRPRMHYGIQASEIKRYATEEPFMTQKPAAIQIRTMKAVYKVVTRYEENNEIKANWLTRSAALFLVGLLLTIAVVATMAVENL